MPSSGQPWYRRAVKLYRAGADVMFLQYQDLFDADRLAIVESRVGAPMQREFAERSLNRTQPTLEGNAETVALNALLDALSQLSFVGDGRRPKP